MTKLVLRAISKFNHISFSTLLKFFLLGQTLTVCIWTQMWNQQIQVRC